MAIQACSTCAGSSRPLRVRFGRSLKPVEGSSSWASSTAVRRSMQANRSRDTRPELALRSRLHALGLRYRVCVRPVAELRRTADVVFGPSRVAVEVRGCFWHCCPLHYRLPETNSAYWEAKISRNVERDRRMDTALADRGWLVIVVWEHEDLALAANQVFAAVTERRPRRSPRMAGKASGRATPPTK